VSSDDDYGEPRRRRRRRRRSHRSEQYEEERQAEESLEGQSLEDRSLEDDGSGEGSGERRRRSRSRRERREIQRPEIRLGTLLRVVGGLVVAAVLIAGGTWYYHRTNSPAAKALAELRALPMVGLVMADEPSVEGRLRSAIDDEARTPTTQGPTRPMIIVGQLRQEYIAPALRRADDASLIAAMTARAELVQHLRATNTAACREFSMGGIRNVDRLDPKGQQLFRNVLAAMETAYRNGRANKDRTYPMPNLQQMGAMLTEAGFQKIDFDKLNSFASLSNDVSCDVELKLNQVPPKLPADKRGPYSRYILGF